MPTTTEKLHISEIAPGVMQSEIRAMTVACEVAGGINLAQGVCDTDVPAPVIQAAIDAIHNGRNIYTRMDGITSLREAIARKMQHYNGISVDPESEVLVASGATGGMYAAALALLDPGDEVILFEPYYGYHFNTMLSLRVRPVTVPLTTPDWSLDRQVLERAVTSRTRAIVLNSPANPSGKVFTRSEIEMLAEFAIKHDLFVFSDEIYEYFLFDGVEHISPATLPGMAERTITISGLSKTFSITGWRIGYITANQRWMPSIAYFHDLVYVCAPSPFQYASAAGLVSLGADFYAALSSDYQQKRNRLCDALSDAGLSPSVPGGAYYVLADTTRLEGITARQKARNLLAKTGIAAVAGSAFFSEGRGENLLRFCFAKKDTDLDRACDALRGLKR